MNKLKLFAIALIGIALLGLTACEEDNPEPSPDPATVAIKFNYVFGPNLLPWSIGDSMFHPKTGDTLIFNLLKYYVSNVRLMKADGTWWSEANSYHLLCGSCPDKSSIVLENVPEGSYTKVEFLMGVDSARNVSGAQTGALSVTNGMFWSWNNGYIMTKIEGHSPNSPTGAFAFHLGGFSGLNNVLTLKTTDLGAQVLEVKDGAQKTLNFQSNLARFWHSSPSVSQKSTIHMPGPEATTMATDFYSNISYIGQD